MMIMQGTWEIYLIHHSHTDIGYTQRQEKIERCHADFIRQAIGIIDAGTDGFVWQCENFWQIENFYRSADASEKGRLEELIRQRKIGLSANYLNFTELIDEHILSDCIGRATAFANRIGAPLTSAMAADVNGFAWGYADILYKNGIRNLSTCINPHHGLAPVHRKQIPFYWLGPNGGRLLVWNGEHYNLGNDLYLVPEGGSSYFFNDCFSDRALLERLWEIRKEDAEQLELTIMQSRVKAYIENLQNEEYPYTLFPVMVSGAVSDNAPPNHRIIERVEKANKLFDGRVIIRMATLEQFFDAVRGKCSDIPEYTGDWNDWWADGVGSTPGAVKLYRKGQRSYRLVKALDPDGSVVDKETLSAAAQNLTIFAEHTWGYSSSVSEPWESLVSELELKKEGYAIEGCRLADRCLDQILAAKGEASIRPQRPAHFRIINPYPHTANSTALLYLELWEYLEGKPSDENTLIEVVDLTSGAVLPSQICKIARAYQIEVQMSLAPMETRDVAVRRRNEVNAVCPSNRLDEQKHSRHPSGGGHTCNIRKIETEHFILSLETGMGVTSIIDKADGLELLQPNTPAPFSGVYEVTPVAGDSYYETRGGLGRRRRNAATRRFQSKLTDLRIVSADDVYTELWLDYALEGTKLYRVSLRTYRAIPKITAIVRIHKTSVWEPENLYVAMPFTAGTEETRYLDKTGCIMRPGIDQLPGSNQEFYLLQNGIALCGQSKTLALAVKDAPLVVFGGDGIGPPSLCNGNNTELNRAPIYSWVANNFWETNFKAETGGFYEFTYSLRRMGKTPPKAALEICMTENSEFLSFHI